MSQTIRGAIDTTSTTVQDMDVDHGRVDILMAKEFVDRPNIVPILRQVSSKGSPRSVKIAAGGAGGRAADLGFPELLGDEVDDALLGLEGAGDAEEGRGLGEDGVALEDAGPEDDVHEAGLVLQRHEGDALCRPRSLAADDEASVADATAVAHGGHGAGVRQPAGGQLRADGRERVAPGAVVGAPVVPDDLLEEAERREGGPALAGDDRQRCGPRVDEPEHVPE